MSKPRTPYQDTKQEVPKFICYKDGTRMYSMGMTKFQQVAKEAGAIYKVNQTVLVNTEILDKYLDGFKIYGQEENDGRSTQSVSPVFLQAPVHVQTASHTLLSKIPSHSHTVLFSFPDSLYSPANC